MNDGRIPTGINRKKANSVERDLKRKSLFLQVPVMIKLIAQEKDIEN